MSDNSCFTITVTLQGLFLERDICRRLFVQRVSPNSERSSSNDEFLEYKKFVMLYADTLQHPRALNPVCFCALVFAVVVAVADTAAADAAAADAAAVAAAGWKVLGL